VNSGIKRIIFFTFFIYALTPVFADGSLEKTQQLLDSIELRLQFNNKITEVNNDPLFNLDKLTPGSAVYVDNYFAGFSTYQHYGVYIGNGKVIHFAPFDGQEISFENGIIHETTLENFLNGRALQIDANIERKFSEQEIIQRARSRIDEKDYDLFFNNCEHFTRWCITGESVSYQVLNFPERLENTIITIREGINSISGFLDSIR